MSPTTPSHPLVLLVLQGNIHFEYHQWLASDIKWLSIYHIPFPSIYATTWWSQCNGKQRGFTKSWLHRLSRLQVATNPPHRWCYRRPSLGQFFHRSDGWKMHPPELSVGHSWRMKIFFQENSPEKNSNHSCYIIIIILFFFFCFLLTFATSTRFFQASGDSSSLWSHDHRCWHFYWSCLSQADSQLLTFSWSFRSDMTWLQGLIPKQHQVRKQW